MSVNTSGTGSVSYTHLDVYKRQEYSNLQETYAELAGQLATAKEELQPMKDIRYWVSKVLMPEQSEVCLLYTSSGCVTGSLEPDGNDPVQVLSNAGR